MNKTVFNERQKLLANFLNIVGATFISTGVLGPVLSVIYGLGPKELDITLVIASSLICILVSGGLHLAAQAHLGGLQE